VSDTTAEIRDSAETRSRILEVAERLFAERGFENTSVRDITAEADCNVAAVNYHFGGKDNLYVEAFRGLLGELRDRRIETIRRDMGNVEEPTLEYFLETFAKGFMDPLVDAGRGRLFLAFINHEMSAPHLPQEVFLDEFLGPLMAVAGEALGRAAPPMDGGTLRLCLLSMVGQLLHALMLRTHFTPEHQAAIVPGDLAAHVRHIVRFTAGGIRACALGIESVELRSPRMRGGAR
jgi:AcrR family transcriptional regulator